MPISTRDLSASMPCRRPQSPPRVWLDPRPTTKSVRKQCYFPGGASEAKGHHVPKYSLVYNATPRHNTHCHRRFSPRVLSIMFCPVARQRCRRWHECLCDRNRRQSRTALRTNPIYTLHPTDGLVGGIILRSQTHFQCQLNQHLHSTVFSSDTEEQPAIVPHAAVLASRLSSPSRLLHHPTDALHYLASYLTPYIRRSGKFKSCVDSVSPPPHHRFFQGRLHILRASCTLENSAHWCLRAG